MGLRDPTFEDLVTLVAARYLGHLINLLAHLA